MGSTKGGGDDGDVSSAPINRVTDAMRRDLHALAELWIDPAGRVAEETETTDDILAFLRPAVASIVADISGKRREEKVKEAMKRLEKHATDKIFFGKNYVRGRTNRRFNARPASNAADT